MHDFTVRLPAAQQDMTTLEGQSQSPLDSNLVRLGGALQRLPGNILRVGNADEMIALYPLHVASSPFRAR
jgi:hypothetical protein